VLAGRLRTDRRGQFGIEAASGLRRCVGQALGGLFPAPMRPTVPLHTAGACCQRAEPAALQWPQRKPWLDEACQPQFSAGVAHASRKPRQLGRDYNESRAIGARASRLRTAEQTGDCPLLGVLHAIPSTTVSSVGCADSRPAMHCGTAAAYAGGRRRPWTTR